MFLEQYRLLFVSRAREKSDSDELLLLLYELLFIFFFTVSIFAGNDVYESLCLLSSKLIFTPMSSKVVGKRLLLFLFCFKLWKDLSESVDILTDE